MELTEELSIGSFSRVSGLTVKALRHYDEIGLLEPARVDEWTGYRYYGLEQARAAEEIRRLRSLEVPLDEIRDLPVHFVVGYATCTRGQTPLQERDVSVT